MAKIYEIDPKKKYLISFPSDIFPGELEKAREILKNWLASDITFLIVPHGTRLIKVEDAEISIKSS